MTPPLAPDDVARLMRCGLLLSAKEAAKWAGVSERTFRRHIRPAIATVKVGARVLFDPQDLEAWVDRQRAGDSETRKESEQPSQSASHSAAESETSAQVLEIERWLRSGPRSSTPEKSTAHQNSQDRHDHVLAQATSSGRGLCG